MNATHNSKRALGFASHCQNCHNIKGAVYFRTSTHIEMGQKIVQWLVDRNTVIARFQEIVEEDFKCKCKGVNHVSKR